MPAASAGPFSVTPATSAPSSFFIARPFGDVVGHLLDAHTEPAAAGLAELAELLDDVRAPSSEGMAKPMPIEPPVGEMIAVLMPIDLAVHVEQRAAGVAAVDGGVGLDEVVVGAGIDVAVARRDDADRDRAAEPERIADRHHPVADAERIRIAELD